MLKNLHTHYQGDTIEKLTSLVERVSTEVSTERAAFTTSSAAASTRDAIETACRSNPKQGREPRELSTRPINGNALLAPASNQSDPQIQFIPRVLSPEELAQADDAFHFDLRSDFDETEFEEEV